MRRLSILYFASVREAVGQDSELRDVSDDVVTAGDLMAWLVASDARYADAFADLSRLRVAVDQQLGDLDTPLGDASEVAFFPPVTGG